MCYFVPAASTQVCYNVQPLCSRRFGGGLTCSRQCQCVVRGGNWHHDAGTLRAVGSLLEVPQVSGRLCQGTRAIPHQMQVSTMCPSHLDCPLNVFACFCLRTENRARKTHFFEYRYFGVGWGGGWGHVNVPCTSYMIYCYAAEISWIVYYVTCCYAADRVGWGGHVNVPCTSYNIYCYAAEISGIVPMSMLLRCIDLCDCCYVNTATL